LIERRLPSILWAAAVATLRIVSLPIAVVISWHWPIPR
jgi:hypothetical protein